jgi:tetratricopeptide (TPR) repeat protein
MLTVSGTSDGKLVEAGNKLEKSQKPTGAKLEGFQSPSSFKLVLAGRLFYRMQPRATHATSYDASNPADLARYEAVMRAAQLNNEARRLSSLGQHDEAIRLHFHAIPIKSHACGDDSVEAGVSWQGLAEALLAINKLPEAKEALDKVSSCRDAAGLTKGLRNIQTFKIRCTLGLGPRVDAAVTREYLGIFWERVETGRRPGRCGCWGQREK